tara:strand:- start:302 stop:514 length:213 start_codon:yes stop_codon:yes gene_type:complete
VKYIDSALKVLIEIARSNNDLLIQDLRNLICTNFARGWRVNVEQSGTTTIEYIFKEGRDEKNPRTTSNIP